MLALVDHEPDFPGPPICTSRAGTSIADGSSLPCSAPWARTARRRIEGVVTPGWTLDEKGRAMSKSRGNDVDPVDIAKRLGGEIVRLWVASVDFREDVVGSEALMQRVGKTTARSAIHSATSSEIWRLRSGEGCGPFEQMEALDQYMLRQTCAMAEDVRQLVR